MSAIAPAAIAISITGSNHRGLHQRDLVGRRGHLRHRPGGADALDQETEVQSRPADQMRRNTECLSGAVMLSARAGRLRNVVMSGSVILFVPGETGTDSTYKRGQTSRSGRKLLQLRERRG